jgi:hypothetical protein
VAVQDRNNIPFSRFATARTRARDTAEEKTNPGGNEQEKDQNCSRNKKNIRVVIGVQESKGGRREDAFKGFMSGVQ